MTHTQKWFMIAAMWLGIIFIIFAFYWIMLRPAGIRKMCAKRAKQVSSETKSGLADMLEINRAIYLDCLRCNGIDQ